jgi:hypothetical protein
MRRRKFLTGVSLLAIICLTKQVSAQIVQFSGASINVPIVSGASINFAVPAEFQQAVGTVSATHSPTSFTILSGNTGSVFSIDNSGNITANTNLSLYSAYSTGVQPTTYTLSVRADNSFGQGVPGTITIVCSQLPWPSLSNRPSVSGGTITWTGPIGGGPSTVNDSSQSHALTTHSGDFTTSSNGQVVQYQDITGNFILQHNNVTLKNCRVQGIIAPWSFTTGGNTGFVVEDCDFTSMDDVATPIGAGHGDGALTSVIMRRCASHDTENNTTKYFVGVVIKDTIFYNVNGADADQVECYTTTTGGPPGGNNGVGPSNNLVVCNNTFQGPLISGVYNSAVNFTNGNQDGAGSPTTGAIGPNMYVDHNFFNDCAPVTGHIICDDNSQGSGTIQWNATNNGFFRTAGQNYRRDATTISTNTGNYNMASAGDFTGTAANGTGAI